MNLPLGVPHADFRDYGAFSLGSTNCRTPVMSTIVVRLVSVCGALMIAAGVARSQTKFEAASVKPCNWVTLPAGARSGGGTGPANISPGRIDLRCWNVFQLINFAYVVNGDPLIGDVRRPMDAQKV